VDFPIPREREREREKERERRKKEKRRRRPKPGKDLAIRKVEAPRNLLSGGKRRLSVTAENVDDRFALPGGSSAV